MTKPTHLVPHNIARYKTPEEWRTLIINMLGGPGWNVELGESELDTALERTLFLFSKYTPKWIRKPLGELQSTNVNSFEGIATAVFDFSEEHPYLNVVDVKFQSNVSLSGSQGSSPYYSFGGKFGVTCGLSAPRRLFQVIDGYERHNRFLGAHPTWEWEENTRKLFISVPTSYIGAKAVAIITRPWFINEIPYHQVHDFAEAAVGFAKQILARILDKFGPIPSASGDLEFDASELYSSGKEALEKVEARLDKSLARKVPMRFMY